MVRSCYICGVTTNISLFGFPKNEAFRKLWSEFCGLNEDLITANTKLCSRHFPEKDFEVKKYDSSQTGKPSRARLKPDVIPSLLRENTFERNTELRQRTCLLCGTCRDGRIHFKFPKDTERRKAWLRQCGYQNESPENAENAYLCQIHFCRDDILIQRSASGCNRLRPNSIPKIYIPAIPCKEITNEVVEICMDSSTSITSEPSDVAVVTDPIDSFSTSSSTPPSTSNSSRKRRFAYVGDISPLDFASPKRARRYCQLLEKEVVKCRRKIDILNKRNRRLVKKVLNYKEIIACLQKNF